MADYYAVLKRTLSGFGEPSQSLRSKIYDKARATISRQLDATQPPLSDETKAAQLAQLDEAIVRMEAEYGGPPPDDFVGDPPPLPIGGLGAEAQPAPEHLPEPAPEPLPEPAPASPPVEEAAPASDEPAGATDAPVDPDGTPATGAAAHDPSVSADETSGDGPAPIEPPSFDPPPAVPDAGEPVAPEPRAIAPEPPGIAPVSAVSRTDGSDLDRPSLDRSAHDASPLDDGPDTARPAPEDALADAFASIERARASEGLYGEAAQPASDVFSPDDFSAAAAHEAANGRSVSNGGATSNDDGPSSEASALAGAGAGAGATAVSTSDLFDDPAVAEREAERLAPPPVEPPVHKSRSGGGVLLFLLLIAALGLLFVFRQPILGAVGVSTTGIDRFVAGLPGVGPYLVGEVEDPDDPTRPKPVPTIRITPEPEPTQDTELGKREQRLGTDGEEVDPAPGREDVGTLPPPSVPAPTVPDADAQDPASDTVTTTVPIETVPGESSASGEPSLSGEPSANGQVADEPTTADQPEVAVVDEPATDTPSAEEAPATQPSAAQPSAAEPAVAVAQSVVLFEEGSGTGGTRSDRGSVVWSAVPESPGNGEPAEPAIRAALDVPERDLKATITIRRNSDRALAASHLMEINFQPAAGFSGNNIDEVLAVRMKPDERSQGTPLSVIPAKIAPGYFYVALDNLPAARERNVKLLRDSKWIDVAVEYTTGRRALLSMEKGVVGERVFGEAFQVWDAAAQ